jgi:hypothetical protein
MDSNTDQHLQAPRAVNVNDDIMGRTKKSLNTRTTCVKVKRIN